MSKSLHELKQELEQLERIVMDEYVRLEAEAAAGGEDYIRIPEQVAHWFRHHLEGVWEDLFGRGRGDLALVDEAHDELRMRLMVLERLLDRDIPFAYLERALSRFLDLRLRDRRAGPVVRTEAMGAPHQANVDTPTGWWALLQAWLAGVLGLLGAGRRPAAAAEFAPRSVTRPPVQSAAAEEGGTAIPEHLQRLILLYKLMQEDELGLIPAEKRLGPLETDLTLQGEIARFYARDLHEQFWNVRIDRAEGIARTPEELRRKLERRNQPYSGVKPRNAA